MTSIRKRQDKYQAQIRINGQSTSKTFTSLANAKSWARRMETNAELSDLPKKKYQPRNFNEVFQRYLQEVTPLKKNTSVEPIIIRLLMRSEWAEKPLSQLTRRDLCSYRDQRLQEIKATSLHRQFCIIKHAARIAEEEWGWHANSSAIKTIRLKTEPTSTVRRISQDDINLLLDAAAASRNHLMQPLITLALETGMRRGALLSFRWTDVEFDRLQISLQKTKSGYPRRIPITNAAEVVLLKLFSTTEDREGVVFDMSANAIRLAFGRIRQRCGLASVRFHDLRYEAISRLFEKGLTMPEVASISGHRSLSQLMRYSHADTLALVDKLRS